MGEVKAMTAGFSARASFSAAGAAMVSVRLRSVLSTTQGRKTSDRRISRWNRSVPTIPTRGGFFPSKRSSPAVPPTRMMAGGETRDAFPAMSESVPRTVTEPMMAAGVSASMPAFRRRSVSGPMLFSPLRNTSVPFSAARASMSFGRESSVSLV